MHCATVRARLSNIRRANTGNLLNETKSALPNCGRRPFRRAAVTVAQLIVLSVGFFPIAATGASQVGLASVYAYSGEQTASGVWASPASLTAAHRTLPFGTLVQVTNKSNGRSVRVRINDRGPFVRGRVIDVTPAAAHDLGFSGLTDVVLTVVGRNRPNAPRKRHHRIHRAAACPPACLPTTLLMSINMEMAKAPGLTATRSSAPMR
jgi:rare lipoprotein A